MGAILIVLLVLLLLGGGIGFNSGWHASYPGPYWGGGSVGLVLIVILLVLVFRG